MRAIRILTLLLFSLPLYADYSGKYTSGQMNISNYCTSGTNCWKALVGSNIADADEGADGQIEIVANSATAGTVYVWNYKTHNWTEHSEIGSTWANIAVQDENNTYLLGTPGTGGCSSPNKPIYFWDGSHTPTKIYGCLTSIYVSKMGSPQKLMGVNANGAGFYSTNQGQTWTQDAMITNSTGVYMTDSTDACLVKSGALYTYQSENGSAWKAFSPSPSGSIAGCLFVTSAFTDANSGDTTGPILMTWGSAGVQKYNAVAGTWSTITTSVQPQRIVGPGLNNIFMVSGGLPYHYNVVPVSLSLTMSGSFSQCPGEPYLECPSGIKHKVTAHISHQHELQGNLASTEGAPTDTISATSTAVSARCDPFFGPSDDPECTVTMDPGVNNEALCEASNTTLATPPPVPQFAGSIDAKSYNGSILAVYSVPIPGGFIVTVACGATVDACQRGTSATCPINNVAVEESCVGTACNLTEEEADAEAKCSLGDPPASWTQITPYLVDVPASCDYESPDIKQPVLVPESFGQVPCD